MVGLGYIGLPTAGILSSNGCQVLGIDINTKVVAEINSGRAHIIEPGLNELIQTAVRANYLCAKTKLTKEDEDIDTYIIAVPTPLTKDNKPDISYVQAAVKAIGAQLKKGDLIILESTSPVGTTAKISFWLQNLRPDLSIPTEDSREGFDVNIAYCPERVLPGKVLHELIYNNRIIGGLTTACADKAELFYRRFVKGRCFKTRARVAAMCKLTENAFRDVNIAFANELSIICDKLDIDVSEVRELANYHPRVDILKPGIGVGGHCLAVDPWFIVDSAPEESGLMKTARQINDYKPKYLVNQVTKNLRAVQTPRVLCLGLSYKPDIDDLRESPAVKFVSLLAENSRYKIFVIEPHIGSLPNNLLSYKNVSLISIDCEIEYDYCIKLVDHGVFLDFNVLESHVDKESVTG